MADADSPPRPEERADALAAVADELYGLAPADFTAERNARAKGLRPDDRELAAEVGRLTKPTAAAWAVNGLLRARRDDVEQALALGEQLRAAQRSLDGAALKEFTAQRRQLVAALARQAAELARDAGPALSPAARTEVEQTLSAALADEGAADAVRSGRLLRALESIGLDPVDLEGAVAAPDGAALSGAGAAVAGGRRDASRAAGGSASGRRRTTGGDGDDGDADDAAGEAERAERERAEERRRREAAARRALDEAGDRLAGAERQADAAERALRSATRDRDARVEDVEDLTSRLEQLQQRLRTAKGELASADERTDAAQRSRDDAVTARDAAELARQRAEDALEAL